MNDISRRLRFHAIALDDLAEAIVNISSAIRYPHNEEQFTNAAINAMNRADAHIRGRLWDPNDYVHKAEYKPAEDPMLAEETETEPIPDVPTEPTNAQNTGEHLV